MDPFEKISHSVDTLFGTGVSKNIPKDIDFKMSKKTGRIRAVYHNGLLLFTPRTDGGIAMSIYCAELFSKNKKLLSKKILIGYKNLNRFDYNLNLKKYLKVVNSFI